MNSLIAVLVSFVVCIMYNLSIFQLAGQEVNGVTSMTAEELYRTFKIFKEKSHDDAPKLVSEAIDQHDFNRDSIKVYGWCLKAPSMHFFYFATAVAFYWHRLWRYGAKYFPTQPRTEVHTNVTGMLQARQGSVSALKTRKIFLRECQAAQ